MRLNDKTGICEHCGRACSRGAKLCKSCFMDGARSRLRNWRPYPESPEKIKIKLEIYDRLMSLWRMMKS